MKCFLDMKAFAHAMREPDTKLRPKVSDEEIDAIKRHSKRFVELAGGPEFFAPVSRVQKAALSKYGSLSEPEIMRCDVALALDREIGAPMRLRGLRIERGGGDEHGGDDRAHGPADDDAQEDIAREMAAREHAGDRTADGDWNEHEPGTGKGLGYGAVPVF
mgnify:CR=1 FL=1